MHDERRPPFYITPDEERRLRAQAAAATPSLVIAQAQTFDDYVRQLMVPSSVMELYRKAAKVMLSEDEAQGIRDLLHPRKGGLLRRILELKAEADRRHPPYIRVACTGKGDYDDLAPKFGYEPGEGAHAGDFGSPVVLEIWPAQHYSPIHAHGDTTGIIHALSGRVDVMVYGALGWDAEKLGVVTLTPGQCAWLAGDRNAVHRVFCPLDGGERPVGPDNLLNDSDQFGATFHVYLNKAELPLVMAAPEPETRDVFRFVDEVSHQVEDFVTYSDLSWHILRSLLKKQAAARGKAG